MADEYAISTERSGDLIKDGFKSEREAYQWLKKQYGDNIDGFIVEKCDIDIKTISFGEFDRQAREFLSELVHEKLQDEGINTESFSYSIEVDYSEQEAK